MEAALIVLLACLLASNWQLRRKVAHSARPRGPPKRDVPIEGTTAAERSGWHFYWFSVVDLSLRLYFLLLRALPLPFDMQVDQDRRRNRHTNR